MVDVPLASGSSLDFKSQRSRRSLRGFRIFMASFSRQTRFRLLQQSMRVQMDQQLRETAMRALEAAPCSIEIPAGTGKTQLLAAAATVAAEQQRRSLVLTHTNAGVEA